LDLFYFQEFFVRRVGDVSNPSTPQGTLESIGARRRMLAADVDTVERSTSHSGEDARSSGEDARATAGLVSNLPHPQVNKTKQHTPHWGHADCVSKLLEYKASGYQ